jgi:lactoylglutathione lyase
MSGKFTKLLGGIGRRALFRGIAGGAALAGLATAAKAADFGPPTDLDESGIRLANFGICVSDLDKSTAFYEALGFEASDIHPIPAPLGHALEAGDDMKLEVRFVRRNGTVIELIHFLNPPPKGKAERRPMNQLGLTHFALRVDDVGRVADIVKKNGGTVIEKSHTKLGPPGKGIEILFCTDPNGVRIELAGPVEA